MILNRDKLVYKKFEVRMYLSKEQKYALNWKASIYIPGINGRLAKVQAADKDTAIQRAKKRIDKMSYKEQISIALEKTQREIDRHYPTKPSVIMWTADKWLQGKIGWTKVSWDGFKTMGIN